MIIPLFWNSVDFACMWIMLRIFICGRYIIEFDYDPTCNYYERGKYGCGNFHVTKLPLVMLRFSMFYSSPLHMLDIFLVLIICLLIKFLCIRSMLNLNMFVTCFMMLFLCFNYYLSCEHR